MYQTIFLATPSKSAFPGGLPVSHSDLFWTGGSDPGRSLRVPGPDGINRPGLRECLDTGPVPALERAGRAMPRAVSPIPSLSVKVTVRERRDCCEESLGDNMTSCVKLKL